MYFTVCDLTKFCGSGGILKINDLAMFVHIQGNKHTFIFAYKYIYHQPLPDPCDPPLQHLHTYKHVTIVYVDVHVHEYTYI
jgi:hypothetical protein